MTEDNELPTNYMDSGDLSRGPERECREGDHPDRPGFHPEYVEIATEAVEGASDADGDHDGWVTTVRMTEEFPAESRFHVNARAFSGYTAQPPRWLH